MVYVVKGRKNVKALSIPHTETLAELKEEVSNVGEIARKTADHQLEERFKKVNSQPSIIIILSIFYISVI